MRWCMRITGAEVSGTNKIHKTLGAIAALAAVALTLIACSQFEQRDKRFYYRALWNFALRECFLLQVGTPDTVCHNDPSPKSRVASLTKELHIIERMGADAARRARANCSASARPVRNGNVTRTP